MSSIFINTLSIDLVVHDIPSVVNISCEIYGVLVKFIQCIPSNNSNRFPSLITPK